MAECLSCCTVSERSGRLSIFQRAILWFTIQSKVFLDNNIDQLYIFTELLSQISCPSFVCHVKISYQYNSYSDRCMFWLVVDYHHSI